MDDVVDMVYNTPGRLALSIVLEGDDDWQGTVANLIHRRGAREEAKGASGLYVRIDMY